MNSITLAIRGHLTYSLIRAKDAIKEKQLAKKQNNGVGGGGDGSALNSEESDGVANIRAYSWGQSSSLLRSRVTYGSFYLRIGAMCKHSFN